MLLNSLESRFSGLIQNMDCADTLLKVAFKTDEPNFGDCAFIISAIWDPRIHFGFKDTSHEKFADYQSIASKIIIKLANKLAASPTTSPDFCQDSDDTVVVTPSSWARCLNNRKRAAPVSDLKTQLDQFYCEMTQLRNDDLLTYWKGKATIWPKLANLARYYSCMNVSSAGAERIFNISGYIFNSKRTKMKPVTLSNAVYSKVNSLLSK